MASACTTVDEILIGTCGWSFDDWVGPVYPPTLDRSRWLAYYAQRLPAIEVNATHYHVPAPPQARTMATRLDAAELRTVTWKAPRDLTHEAIPDESPDRVQREAERFFDALEPALELDVLDGILVQFSHTADPEAVLDGLDAVLEQNVPAPLFVEVRNASFNEDRHHQPLLERAASTGGTVVATDSPAATITKPFPGQAAYFRFHGRNTETWFMEDPPGEHGSARYDHAYTDEELDELVERIEQAPADRVYAFFNNHAGGKAFDDALALMERLGIEEPSDRVTLDDF